MEIEPRQSRVNTRVVKDPQTKTGVNTSQIDIDKDTIKEINKKFGNLYEPTAFSGHIPQPR